MSWAACTLPEAGAWDGALHSPFGNSDLETLVMLNPKLFLVINCVLSLFYLLIFRERGTEVGREASTERTCGLQLCGTMPSPLSHSGKGCVSDTQRSI